MEGVAGPVNTEDLVAERDAVYGPAHEDLSRAGRIWGALLERWRYTDQQNVPPELVALCMVGIKQSRLVHTPSHADSAADIRGFAACLEEVQAWRLSGSGEDQ